jgi:predicted Zn-dependent protease
VNDKFSFMEYNKLRSIRLSKSGIYMISAVFFIVSAVAVQSCVSSPTGRKQLTMMTDAQMNEMGIKSFDEIKQQTPIEKGAAVNKYVKCVGNAILSVAEDNTGVSSWEIVVFKDDSANAFALPGGKIGVHTGILAVAKTPGQLAAVMAHEVSHVLARHGNERVSQTVITSGGISALESILGDASMKDMILGGLGAGAQYGVLLPFSRAHETEADVYGQKLMAKAGFNPAESVELWVNMSQMGGGSGPELLSTHPASERRIQDLKDGLKETAPIFVMAQGAGKRPDCKM